MTAVVRLCRVSVQEAESLLLDYPFPGNVRELRNVIERAVMECRESDIEPAHLHFFFAPNGTETPSGSSDTSLASALPFDLDRAAFEAEAAVLDLAIEKAGGNLTEAARLLNTTRNRVYRIVRRKREGGA